MKISIKIIEKKIVAIKKISKISKAMKIIAAMNFKKALSHLVDFSLVQEINNEVFATLNYLFLNEEHVVKKTKKDNDKNKKILWIVFASDLGLCGSFNTKIFDTLNTELNSQNAFVIIGKKAQNYFKNRNVKILKSYLSFHFVSENLDNLIDFLLLRKNDFTEIKVVYSEIQAKFLIKLQLKQLFPVVCDDLKNRSEILSHFIIEGSTQTLLERTIVLYFKNLLLLYYWNSRASEERVRHLTMDSANENSDDMINDLKLKYNQLRQEKITKEILLVSQDGW